MKTADTQAMGTASKWMVKNRNKNNSNEENTEKY